VFLSTILWTNKWLRLKLNWIFVNFEKAHGGKQRRRVKELECPDRRRQPKSFIIIIIIIIITIIIGETKLPYRLYQSVLVEMFNIVRYSIISWLWDNVCIPDTLARYWILQYCMESQIRQRGYDPATSLICIKPRPVTTIIAYIKGQHTEPKRFSSVLIQFSLIYIDTVRRP